jgi:4-amino-4-deoxy-L-arabinose transferase-like glycosyltransferase
MRAPSVKSGAKSAAASAPVETNRLKPRDAAILAVVLGVALLLMAQSGLKRGVELMPWPDGLEYAAAAINLDQGRGAVLHFGGYSYPSRYTEGYPLILAAAYPILGREVAKLVYATVALGLFAIIALYLLTLELFGRAAATIATALLAVSPIFVTYSTLVLSDVPTLAVSILAALALVRATRAEPATGSEQRAGTVYWAIFGLLAGFTVMIRPTNAAILIGVAAGLFAAPPPAPKSRKARVSLLAFAIGFAPMPLWQARENLAHLGRAFASGYAWWLPEVYGSFSRTFNAGYLFGPTMPRNPWGNLPVYLLTLCGLDGWLSNPGAPSFYLYPFSAAAFAVVGIAAALRAERVVQRRIVWFGLGFLAALVAIYAVYVFTDVAFILPGCFILFAAAGYGAALANRRLIAIRSKRRRSAGESALVAMVVIFDLLLVTAIAREVASRFSVAPAQSEVAPALRALDRQIDPGAEIASNLALQFLELYMPGPGRSFIGLHSFDPGGDFTDYHLSRLYAKKSQTWDGPIPPALFDGAGIIATAADALAAQARAGRPAYLLLWIPPQADYAQADYTDLLKEELDRLGDHFAVEETAHADTLVLYRLKPR